jgi:hypothetical protein
MLNGRPRYEAAAVWRKFIFPLADGFQSLQSSL